MAQSPEDDRKRVRYVLDASAFLNSSFLPEGDLYVPPSVVSELRSEKRHMVPDDVRIVEPSAESRERVRKTAARTGDLLWLSGADLDVLALALDVGGVLVSDDFHVQNVAAWMGIAFEGITARIREKVVWRRVCPACGEAFPPGVRVCPRCGVRLTLRRTRCCL